MSATNQRSELPVGYRLHWYSIERVLGRGGFGITYLANDENLDQKVAIKEFLPTDLAFRTSDNTIQPLSDSHIETYQWGLGRFLVEARTLAKFRHPNIVLVHSVFEANNTAYIVMEYETGSSLDQAYSAGRLGSESELTSLLRSLMDGVECMHNEGFVHRDIKPSNIYLRNGDHPILLDFGSARQALGMETKTLTTMVSPGYAPFEQYNATREKDGQGPWTDIYALGSTIYKGLSGKDPSDALSLANDRIQGHQEVLNPASIAGEGRYSSEFLNAIDVSMRFNAAERPQSIAKWRDMLGRKAVSTDDVTVFSPPPKLANAVNWSNEVVDVVGTDADDSPTPSSPVSEASQSSFAASEAVAATSEAVSPVSQPAVAASEPMALSDTDSSQSRQGKKLWPITAAIAVVAAGAAFFIFGGGNRSKDTVDNNLADTEEVTTAVNTTTNQDKVTPENKPESPEVSNVEVPKVVDFAALAKLDCASLTVGHIDNNGNRVASVAADKGLPSGNNQFFVSGFTTESARIEFDRALSDVSSIESVDDSQITVVPDAFCDQLKAIGPIATSGPANVSLQTTVADNQFVEGDRLVVQYSSAAFDTNYFYIDYFSLDGGVLHMLSEQSEQSNQAPRGEDVLLGEEGGIERWEIAAPFGEELIAVLVTNTPLGIGARPEAESADEYLSSLQKTLADLGENDIRAAIIKIETRGQ